LCNGDDRGSDIEKAIKLEPAMATPFYHLSSLALLNISQFLCLLRHNLVGNQKTNTKKGLRTNRQKKMERKKWPH
jgi:Tfp pilus assembly protein PilF